MTDKNTTEPCGKCNERGFIVGILPSEPPCPHYKERRTMTDKHTPKADPRTVKGGTCRDCRYSDFYLTIVTCKLHAAAPVLLEALEEAQVYLEDGAVNTALDIINNAIKAAQ